MVTKREMAIARTVIYASLFDYPLTLEQLHHSLIESDQTPAEILAVYEGSELLRDLVARQDGFFFPVGRGDLIAERRRRETRSDAFLTQHRRVLRLIGALPFTRLVALSGSVAHRNLEPDGDLDLFIVTRGPRVWTVTVMLIVLARLLGRRRTICANFVLADSHLVLEQTDLFTANQVIHLQPLVGSDMVDRFRAVNPFVARWYPNSGAGPAALSLPGMSSRGIRLLKRVMEGLLALPAPLIETLCRRAYAWHLGRKAAMWRSPNQVRLQSDYLKLHTRSHRDAVMDRFQVAVETLVRTAQQPRRDELTKESIAS
jgi:hypothetical protein